MKYENVTHTKFMGKNNILTKKKKKRRQFNKNFKTNKLNLTFLFYIYKKKKFKLENLKCNTPRRRQKNIYEIIQAK